MASVRGLDPACGSGNFLSVSMQQLLNSEREIINFAAKVGLPILFPEVGLCRMRASENSIF
jgi:type I restriction-modification system DNA methylase subunit